MATVTRENIGVLTDKLTVKIEKSDYLPSFEKKLKEYGKTANIPGFRKGMVPAGMIKKMYGSSIFNEEVVRGVEKQLYTYLNEEKPDIFAQPLPLGRAFDRIDLNNPDDYSFDFEIGLKPESYNVDDEVHLSFPHPGGRGLKPPFRLCFNHTPTVLHYSS